MLNNYKKILLGIAALLFVTITANLIIAESTEEAFNRVLQEQIAAGNKDIRVRDLTDFDWDRVCYLVFSEDYAFDSAEISKVIDRPYKGKHPQKRCDTDRYNALLFLSNDSNTLINVDQCSLITHKPAVDKAGNVCFSRQVYFEVESHPKMDSWRYLHFRE